jgi:hypothetical protein
MGESSVLFGKPNFAGKRMATSPVRFSDCTNKLRSNESQAMLAAPEIEYQQKRLYFVTELIKLWMRNLLHPRLAKVDFDRIGKQRHCKRVLSSQQL